MTSDREAAAVGSRTAPRSHAVWARVGKKPTDGTTFMLLVIPSPPPSEIHGDVRQTQEKRNQQSRGRQR